MLRHVLVNTRRHFWKKDSFQLTCPKSVRQNHAPFAEKKKDKGKGTRSTPAPEAVEEKVEKEPEKKAEWLTTLPSGKRHLTQLDGTQLPVKDVAVCTASDPMTKQVNCRFRTFCFCTKSLLPFYLISYLCRLTVSPQITHTHTNNNKKVSNKMD